MGEGRGGGVGVWSEKGKMRRSERGKMRRSERGKMRSEGR